MGFASIEAQLLNIGSNYYILGEKEEDKKALDKIIRFGVERMAYISCKPTSLARDLEVLQSRGYAVELACCVDMFPFSANIETVCLLSNRKSKPDSYVDLSINMEDYHRIKNEEK